MPIPANTIRWWWWCRSTSCNTLTYGVVTSTVMRPLKIQLQKNTFKYNADTLHTSIIDDYQLHNWFFFIISNVGRWTPTQAITQTLIFTHLRRIHGNPPSFPPNPRNWGLSLQTHLVFPSHSRRPIVCRTKGFQGATRSAFQHRSTQLKRRSVGRLQIFFTCAPHLWKLVLSSRMRLYLIRDIGKLKKVQELDNRSALGMRHVNYLAWLDRRKLYILQKRELKIPRGFVAVNPREFFTIHESIEVVGH